MHARLLALALAALAATSPTALAGEGWYDEFDAAQAAAKAQGKDLLVDFTGSDWCGWCIRLHDEVFGKEEFIAAAQEDFVLLALDYPKKQEALSRVPDIGRNRELQRKYGVRSFPTVLLMNAEGEAYAKTGYKKGGVKPYLTQLAQLRAEERAPLTAAELVEREFEAADEARRLEIFEQVYPVLSSIEHRSPYAERIAPAARWASEADPATRAELRERGLRALLWSAQASAEQMAATRELDPQNERGLLELAVRADFLGVRAPADAVAAVAALDGLAELGFQRKDVGFELYFTAAQWYAGPLSDPARKLACANKAKEIGTDDRRFEEALKKLIKD